MARRFPLPLPPATFWAAFGPLLAGAMVVVILLLCGWEASEAWSVRRGALLEKTKEAMSALHGRRVVFVAAEGRDGDPYAIRLRLDDGAEVTFYGYSHGAGFAPPAPTHVGLRRGEWTPDMLTGQILRSDAAPPQAPEEESR